MYRVAPIVIAVIALVPGCQGGSNSHSQTWHESDRFKIPDETNEFGTFIFRDRDGNFAYAVVRYGWFNELFEWSGRGTNINQVSIGGKPITVPKDGAIYVVDPNLELHRLPIKAETLHAQLPKARMPGETIRKGFFESRLWKEELIPSLKQYEWRRPDEGQPK